MLGLLCSLRVDFEDPIPLFEAPVAPPVNAPVGVPPPKAAPVPIARPVPVGNEESAGNSANWAIAAIVLMALGALSYFAYKHMQKRRAAAGTPAFRQIEHEIYE
jgi:hypothetical protein